MGEFNLVQRLGRKPVAAIGQGLWVRERAPSRVDFALFALDVFRRPEMGWWYAHPDADLVADLEPCCRFTCHG